MAAGPGPGMGGVTASQGGRASQQASPSAVHPGLTEMARRRRTLPPVVGPQGGQERRRVVGRRPRERGLSPHDPGPSPPAGGAAAAAPPTARRPPHRTSPAQRLLRLHSSRPPRPPLGPGHKCMDRPLVLEAPASPVAGSGRASESDKSGESALRCARAVLPRRPGPPVCGNRFSAGPVWSLICGRRSPSRSWGGRSRF